MRTSLGGAGAPAPLAPPAVVPAGPPSFGASIVASIGLGSPVSTVLLLHAAPSVAARVSPATRRRTWGATRRVFVERRGTHAEYRWVDGLNVAASA